MQGPLIQLIQLAQYSLGLSLSPTAAPFPKKLFTRVQVREFVETMDLLSGHMSLLQRFEMLGGQSVATSLPVCSCVFSRCVTCDKTITPMHTDTVMARKGCKR